MKKIVYALVICCICCILVINIPIAAATNYTVDISSYDAFRSATIGKGYDIDNAYGVQCWDGAALLWQQLGRGLSTGGTKGAHGCWDVDWAREENAGSEFTLIYNFSDVKRGDIVVMLNTSENSNGHICFADEDYNGTNALKIYGQNQAGTSVFNVIRHGSIGQYFLGAFRYKKWHGQPLYIGADSGSGQVTGAQSGALIPTGNTVTLTATPLSGYTFDSWYITDRNTIALDSSNPYTFTMPDHEISIEASFKIISNTVVKRWKNVSANTTGSSLSMSAMLEIDASTLFGVEMPHVVTYPRILVSTSQGLGNPYSKYYDTPQDEVTTINGGKRHRYAFSLNNVSELVNDAGQSLQLLPGTVYYYRWMAVINDNLYTSDLYSFTARNPLVTWSDLCTNGGTYNGLFNGVVRWDKSLSMQEVGCFVSTNRDAVRGASRQNHNGCAFKNDTTIKMDSSVTTDAANGTWVFYKGPSFDTITSFAANTTYYYKFYAYTSDNVETFSEIMPYTPEGDTTKPQIVSASVSNVTRNGYDVNVVATDNVGLKEIWIGTWNDVIGIDAAKWQVAVPNSNGSVSFGINISEFDNVQNTTYHTNAVAYDIAGNQSEIVRAGDPYINGILTSVWMTPQTDYSISAGESITLNFGADQPVDWYKHIIDMSTSNDSGGLVSASSTGGSTTITFNTPGYYKVFMGAWHVSGDMYTDAIYVSVLSSIVIDRPGSNNLMRGDTIQLMATTVPAEYDHTKLVWTSSYPEIVSVSSDGVATAHQMTGDDYVIITCQSPDGSVSGSTSFRVFSNMDYQSFFYVDGVPTMFDDAGTYGIIGLIRQPGDVLECDVDISFLNDLRTYDVEYMVEEGNIVLNNGKLYVTADTDAKNVVSANIYEVRKDGTRGRMMDYTFISVYRDIGGGVFALPENLNVLGENAFEGVAAKKYVLPASLTELTPGCLAGIPRGSWIFFNSDTVSPFNDFEVLGLSYNEIGCKDYVWFDTDSFTYIYYEGNGGYANYCCLPNQVKYHWSDWTTEAPAAGKEYETKTQYRTAPITYQPVYSAWSGWSDWTISRQSIPNSSIKEEQIASVSVYYYFQCSNCGKHMPYWGSSHKCYTDLGGCGASNTIPESSWHGDIWLDTPHEACTKYNSIKYYTTRNSELYWRWTDSTAPSSPQTGYRYRTRTVTGQTPIIGQYGAWSDEAAASSSTISVETRVLYRYRIHE